MKKGSVFFTNFFYFIFQPFFCLFVVVPYFREPFSKTLTDKDKLKRTSPAIKFIARQSRFSFTQ